MFSQIFDAIEEWMRELLTGMITSNLDTMFTDVNQKTGEIATQVGQTPQGWNGSIFSMIQNLSDSVIMPIAGIIITLVLCYELISMLTERNNIKRALTTTSTAIFVPFTTQELFMAGESLYYGLNALSNNMIMVDRKKLKNPNGLILGTPGSGKSFAAKREITNAFFVTKDDIIIGDPEGEYYPLVHALGGQVVHISPTSKDYINPMDINMDYSDDDNPLGVKSDFVLSLCELIMGSRDGIEAEEKSVIDRCLPLVYQKYFADPKPENMPVLGDLYDCLRKQKEPQAQRIATALEKD